MATQLSRKRRVPPWREKSLWEDDDAYALTAADVAAGSFVFQLSYVPIEESVAASWGGVGQQPTAYTVDSDGFVTWPLGGFERAGDVFWFHYQCRKRVVPEVVLGWRYLDTANNTDAYDTSDPRSQVGYDDSAWPLGNLPFSTFDTDIGNGWEPAEPGGTGTLWEPLHEVWLRSYVTAPQGVDLLLTIRLDNAAVVWWNGSVVYSAVRLDSVEQTFTVPGASVTGHDLVAIRAWDRGGGGTNQGYIDLFPLTLAGQA